MSSGHDVNVAGGAGDTVTVAGEVGQPGIVAKMCPCQSGGNIDEVPSNEEKKDFVTPCDERVTRYVATKDVILHKNMQDEDHLGLKDGKAHEKNEEGDIDDENATNEDFDRTPRPSYSFGSLYKIRDSWNEVFQLQENVNLDYKICSETRNTNIKVTEDLNRTPRNSHCFGHPYNVGLDWQNSGNRVCWDDCLHVCFLNKFLRRHCRNNSI
uniref:Uncharacterized protein n=1 Tax=Cacopsylla melanoneura TaxID=428564 RepID=A0A8D9F3T2_9HEMI